MIQASPYWIRFSRGRFGVLWLFPWGWLYDWRSFLWGYAPDDESWWMRICGVEIWLMRRKT
jgi:hypothetical protein